MVAGGIVCFRCRRPGHKAADCPEGRRGGRRNLKCFHCGQRGHVSKDCRSHREIKVEKHADDRRSATATSDFTLKFDKKGSPLLHVTNKRTTPADRRRTVRRAIDKTVDAAIIRALAEVSRERKCPLVHFVNPKEKQWGKFRSAPQPSYIQKLRWREKNLESDEDGEEEYPIQDEAPPVNPRWQQHQQEAAIWEEIASGEMDLDLGQHTDNTPLLMPVDFGTVVIPKQQ